MGRRKRPGAKLAVVRSAEALWRQAIESSRSERIDGDHIRMGNNEALRQLGAVHAGRLVRAVTREL